MLLSLAADRSAAIAEPRASGVRHWVPIPPWTARRLELIFEDPQADREYRADLSQSTLGGTWQRVTRRGGWWCKRLGDPLSVAAPYTQRSGSNDQFPFLVPMVMSTPRYPRQAIREAKEGRAVVCFLVEPDGSITDGSIVELSDRLFARPSIRAISASRFRGWEAERGGRPACRGIDYRLDAIY